MNASSKLPAPINRKGWLSDATQQLKAAGIPTPRLDAELLLTWTENISRTELLAHDDKTLDNNVVKTLDQLLDRRLQRIPLAYLFGKKEFYGRDFIVSPDVLIPRPETETLVDLAKEYRFHGTIIDIGCGSGCLGITVAIETGTELFASDVSEDALEITAQNAAIHGLTATCAPSFLLQRWKKYTFDAIVANLPYVDSTWERSPETDHEPALALFALDGGLSLIKQLIEQSPSRLSKDGYLLLEADPEQHHAIITHAQKHGFTHVESREYAVLLRKS